MFFFSCVEEGGRENSDTCLRSSHLRRKEMSARAGKEKGKRDTAKNEKRNKPRNKTSGPKTYPICSSEKLQNQFTKEAKNYIHSAECEESLFLDEVSAFSDLSHAWVVSFVGVKALVDLFRQPGVLLRAPTTQQKRRHKSESTPIRHALLAPEAAILAVTDCRILLECVAQSCDLLCQIFHHFVLCRIWL